MLTDHLDSLFYEVTVQVIFSFFYWVIYPFLSIFWMWILWELNVLSVSSPTQSPAFSLLSVFWKTQVLNFNIIQFINFLFMFRIVCVSFKKYLQTSLSQRCYPMFPLKALVFYLSYLTLQSIWNCFIVWYKVGSVSIFPDGYPIVSTPFTKKDHPFPNALQCCLCHKSGYHICEGLFLDSVLHFLCYFVYSCTKTSVS